MIVRVDIDFNAIVDGVLFGGCSGENARIEGVFFDGIVVCTTILDAAASLRTVA